MKRRKFIQYSLIGGGSFILNLDLYNPQPADAFIFGFLFRALLSSAFRGFQIRDKRWYKARKDVMLAEREFIRQQFTNLAVAQVDGSQYNVIAASERQEPLANNVGFAFPRIEYNQETIATVGGPASVGMTYAAEYLKRNRNMDASEVNASIIPSLDGGTTYSNMQGWSDSTSFNHYPNNYSDTGVRVRYDAVNPRRGGFGIIDVSVNANQLIRIPPIRIDFT
ncbi:MAG: hypothetical protein HEQ12_01255 [Aphanizomenon flos-aquae DEX188]|jgi:hypothetical protein|nr:MAG: hypothetical protein HEQ12_01255 [Aphanizomenon flos-aquae DEX188]